MSVYEWFVSSVTGFLTTVPWVIVLVCFMVMDIITGFFYAYKTKSLSSSYSRDGTIRKVMLLAAVATGMLVEVMMALALTHLPKEIQPGGGVVLQIPWGAFIAFLFCVVELTSIGENLAKCGVPMPRRMLEMFAVISHAELVGGKKRQSQIVELNLSATEPLHVKVDSDQLNDDSDLSPAQQHTLERRLARAQRKANERQIDESG